MVPEFAKGANEALFHLLNNLFYSLFGKEA